MLTSPLEPPIAPARPAARNRRAWLIAGLALLLIASAALVIVVLRRFSRRPARVADVAAPAASATYDARLDDELRDLD